MYYSFQPKLYWQIIKDNYLYFKELTTYLVADSFFARSLSTQTLQKINIESKNSANTDLSRHKETKFYNELLCI